MSNILMRKKIIGVIPARMLSSRFYGKPLAKIEGKEMIKWVYENSKASSILKDVYVATDHEDIQAFCQRKNIPCLMTSPEHKNCAERSNEVSQRLGADIVVEIQGDEPTLATSEIDNFITESLKHEKFDMTTLCTDLPAEQADDTHKVKVVFDKDYRALFFSRSPIPCNFKSKPVRYYKTIGIFLWTAQGLKRFSETPKGYLESIEDTHMLRLIENQFKAFLVYTPRDAVGVDLLEDIKHVEAFLKKL